MTVTTYPVRLFGGRDLGVTYDSVAGTLSVLNQSINISSLSTSLQAQWANAVATTTAPWPRPAFAGDNISATVGEILSNQAAWRSAVAAALAAVVSEQTSGGLAPDVQTFNRT